MLRNISGAILPANAYVHHRTTSDPLTIIIYWWYHVRLVYFNYTQRSARNIPQLHGSQVSGLVGVSHHTVIRLCCGPTISLPTH